MTLADTVLPLVRTRANLYRWSVANAHGAQMHDAVGMLEAAVETDDPTSVFAVTQKAIASAVKVIMRADDSSGIIGDACRDLLNLHSRVAARAHPPASKLVDWMMTFQFHNECDFFTIDPVAYAPALGDEGMRLYRTKLSEIESCFGLRLPGDEKWSSPHSHEWFVFDWNAQRLAVFDRDIEAIIRTHAQDRKVAAQLEDTAKALEEIGEIDLAIDWAKHATWFDFGHQSQRAANYWCELLAQHRRSELLVARLEVFRRWPSSSTAAYLYQDASTAWSSYCDEVMTSLTVRPLDAIIFVLHSVKNIQWAWDLAHSLALEDDQTWSDLATVYVKIDPLAVLPVHAKLVENELIHTGAQYYRAAARRLARMRRIAAGVGKETEVDEFIGQLRETHRRRPRLQQEFNRAKLP
jgi:hypothetical protein